MPSALFRQPDTIHHVPPPLNGLIPFLFSNSTSAKTPLSCDLRSIAILPSAPNRPIRFGQSLDRLVIFSDGFLERRQPGCPALLRSVPEPSPIGPNHHQPPPLALPVLGHVTDFNGFGHQPNSAIARTCGPHRPGEGASWHISRLATYPR